MVPIRLEADKFWRNVATSSDCWPGRMAGVGTVGEPHGSINGALFDAAACANLAFAVKAEISLGRLWVVVPVAGRHQEPPVKRWLRGGLMNHATVPAAYRLSDNEASA